MASLRYIYANAGIAYSLVEAQECRDKVAPYKQFFVNVNVGEAACGELREGTSLHFPVSFFLLRLRVADWM
jgi:hypothetical protein